MKLIRKFLHFIEAINEGFLQIASWLTLILVLLTTEQVIARYLFNASSIALQELEWHLFGAIFLLAGAATLAKNEHVRVDIIYGKFSQRGQAYIDCLGTLLFLVPGMVILIVYGIDFVTQARSFASLKPDNYFTSQLINSEQMGHQLFGGIEKFLRQTILVGEGSANPGGLEARWLIKALIPFSAALMLLQGLVILIKNFRKLQSHD